MSMAEIGFRESHFPQVGSHQMGLMRSRACHAAWILITKQDWRRQPIRLGAEQDKVAKQQRDRDPFQPINRVQDAIQHVYQSGEGPHEEEPARAGGMIPQSGD